MQLVGVQALEMITLKVHGKFHKFMNTDTVLRMAHCAKQLRSDNHCSHVRSLHREEVPPPWVPVPLAGYVPTTQLISLIHYGLQIVYEEVFLLEKKSFFLKFV